MPLLESPLRRRYLLVGGTPDPDDLRSVPVPAGELWRINRIAWENETDEMDRVRSYIFTSGYRHWLDEWVAPAGGFLYVDDKEHLLGEGEQVGIQLTGIDASDVCRLYVSGHRLVDSDRE